MDFAAVFSSLNGLAAIAVVLGLCLYFHEAGHFLAAKLFRCTVHDFAFGFGPSLIAKKWGETTYRFNVVPFGGYVRIAGMEPGSEPEPGGFYALPRYKSAVILFAGVAMNVVLAVLVYSGVTLWRGVPDPSDDGIYVEKVMPNAPAVEAGFLPGDKIVAVEGCRHSVLVTEVSSDGPGARAGLKRGTVITMVNGGEVALPSTMYELARQSGEKSVELAVLDPDATSLADQQQFLSIPVPTQSPDADADLAELLSAAWGIEFGRLQSASVSDAIALRPAEQVEFTVERDGQEITLTATTDATWARRAERDRSGAIEAPHKRVGRLGVVLGGASKPVGLVDAVRTGARQSYSAVDMVIQSLWLLATRQVRGGAGGPIAIMAATAEHARVGWDAVLSWTGLISANLAVMNLIPFPPFDGFRLCLLGVEGIMRRRAPAKFELAVTMGGFIAIVIFLLLISSNDIINLIRYGTP